MEQKVFNHSVLEQKEGNGTFGAPKTRHLKDKTRAIRGAENALHVLVFEGWNKGHLGARKHAIWGMEHGRKKRAISGMEHIPIQGTENAQFKEWDTICFLRYLKDGARSIR